MKKSVLLLSVIFLFTASLFAQNDGNGGGAVRISFGNDEHVEPVTLSGDAPAIPPKPKAVFHTNSIVLNQILAECEEVEALQTTLDLLQKSSKISISTEENCPDCFTIVINSENHKIIAVLDKGKGKRMNLLNNQFETDAMYEDAKFEKMRFLLME